jgi:hypothetical protein
VLALDLSLGQTTRALGEALGSASQEVASGSVYHAVGSIVRERGGDEKESVALVVDDMGIEPVARLTS